MTLRAVTFANDDIIGIAMKDVSSNMTIAVIMVCLACHEEENWWSKTQMGRMTLVGDLL